MTLCMFVTLFARKGPLPNWYLDPPLLRTLRSSVGVFYGRDSSLAPWEQAWGFECPPSSVASNNSSGLLSLDLRENTAFCTKTWGCSPAASFATIFFPLLVSLPFFLSCLSAYLFPSFIFSPKSQISPGWKNLPSDPVLVPGVDAAANPGRARLLWDAVVCPAGLHLRPRVIFERE